MKHAFLATGEGIEVLLAPAEREVVRAVPILLRNTAPDDGDPTWARRTEVYPGDPSASASFRELTDGMLDEARTGDRDRFEETIEDARLSFDDAEAWMRAIGEARLRVAARLGIEDDGWGEEPLEAELVELTVLRVLGVLQQSLVEALAERL